MYKISPHTNCKYNIVLPYVYRDEVSFIRIFSFHTYFWIIIYAIYISVSFTQGLSHKATDVFYYLDIFSIVWLIVVYLIHVVTMFLSAEWKTINRKHSKLWVWLFITWRHDVCLAYPPGFLSYLKAGFTEPK